MSDSLSGPILARLIAQARESAPHEICGFVLRHWRQLPIRNLMLAKPDAKYAEFAMDPEEQVKAQLQYKGDILGVYHSHPSGQKHPSPIDLEYWPARYRYWIVTGQGIYEWSRIGDGQPKLVWSWEPESSLLDTAVRVAAESIRPASGPYPA